jgi:hypothetical protein
MPPVALGWTIRDLEDEETATLDDAAEDAAPKGRTAKRMRKVSLTGQIRNQVSGPYNQRRKTSQMIVVRRM